MDANKLVINVEKSCILLFSRVGTLHPEITGIVTSRGKVQRPVNGCAKYLAVIVDENLSFLPHIHAVELKLSRNLGIMKKLKQTFPRKTLTFSTMHSLDPTYSIAQWYGNRHSNPI